MLFIQETDINQSRQHLKFTQNRTSNNDNTVNILDKFY